MSKKSPRNYSAEFKAKVALEAIRAEKTIRQIATKYSIHATQINRWKSHGNRSSKNEHELKIEAVLFIYGSKSLYCH